MGIARFVLGRLAGMVVVLLVIALVTFVVFYLLPSDPARMSCGRPCSPESLATAKQFMQLDQPWYQQFASFLGGIFTGRTFGSGVTAIHCPAPCFGYSFQQNEETLHLIMSRLPVTASIALGAAIIWLLAGVGVGVLSALRPGRPVDRIAMAGAVAGVSTPVCSASSCSGSPSTWSRPTATWPSPTVRPTGSGTWSCRGWSWRSCTPRSTPGSPGPRCSKHWARTTSAPHGRKA